MNSPIVKRTTLSIALLTFGLVLPTTLRAAEPAPAPNQLDPFASPEDAKPAPAPTPVPPDQEDALIAAPPRPAQEPATAPPTNRPPASVRRPAPSVRRTVQASDEDHVPSTAAPAPVDQSGFALELSTAGFASGTLAGGLFLGGRTAGGTIMGGFVDYVLTSATANAPGGDSSTTSRQSLRIGAGVRQPFVRSADGRVDLFGAMDFSFEHRSAELPGATTDQSSSASGFSLALGPGLRLWVHDQIAIGYTARLRMTYLSGSAAALTNNASIDPTLDTTLSAVAFDGTFQLLGIF
jgi:hypothetical protein